MNRPADLRPLQPAGPSGCPSAPFGRTAARHRRPAPRGRRAASRLPVVLVHGYPGTAASWLPLRSALAAAGFGHVVGLEEAAVALPPDALAELVTRRAFEAMTAAGTDRVHLVGHGAGGAALGPVTAHEALGSLVATSATVATSHRRSIADRVPGGPGSGSPAAATAGRRGHRWVSYFSDVDHLVPPHSARLAGSGPDRVNVLVPGCGHLTICRDRRLVRSVVAELSRSERAPVPAALAEDPMAALAA